MTAERCACGQYPDVCARYGHAEGHEQSAVPQQLTAERAILAALQDQNLVHEPTDGRAMALPVDIGTAMTLMASLRAKGWRMEPTL